MQDEFAPLGDVKKSVPGGKPYAVNDQVVADAALDRKAARREFQEGLSREEFKGAGLDKPTKEDAGAEQLRQGVSVWK